MADEDDIDILGDFSFNSCLAQNNQGMVKEGFLRRLSGNNSMDKQNVDIHTTWNKNERELLVKEMAKYGRNVRKISQTLKTKTEAEIQALIEAEYGVNLDTPMFGLEDNDEVPAVVQEEIVTDDTQFNNVNNILNTISTVPPTAMKTSKKPFRKKTYIAKPKNSLLRPDALLDIEKPDFIAINPSEIFYEDDLMIGSTESIGSDLDSMDIISKNIVEQKEKVKAVKKIGNHRRKVSRNFDKSKPRNNSKDILKSPQGGHKKSSSLSEDNAKSPKMQIVLGSGVALPVSEGEEVIKIEKKKDSESESDIEVDDIDSEFEGVKKNNVIEQKVLHQVLNKAPVAVPVRKFEPMRKRHKKINLDGGGGYTIMHTESGDLYEVAAEPRKERQPRKQPIHLIQCRVYNAERPAPYEVLLHVSTLICMDVHAHSSRGEVMGLLGGSVAGGRVTFTAYRRAAAASCRTHCDMDPVSQAVAAEWLRARGARVCGWHHSHPQFPAAPSALDLRTQRALQRALERAGAPFLGLITSQHWPTGRTASQYRCIRVEDSLDAVDVPVGYQLSVKLVRNLAADNVTRFIRELRDVIQDRRAGDELTVDMARDTCPQAGITYLEKCISSIRQHMRSAGYAEGEPVTVRVLQGAREALR